MAKARLVGYPIEDELAKGVVKIHCIGCNEDHYINTKPYAPNIHVWGFNGNFDKPTFTPSLLNKSGLYVDGCKLADESTEDGRKWNEFIKKNSAICHSYITDGKIQYLGDCTHSLKGQTIELPDIDQP